MILLNSLLIVYQTYLVDFLLKIVRNQLNCSMASKPEIKYTKLFINNEFVDAVSGRTFATIDPSDETEIAQIAEADEEDVDKAVKAARQAFKIGLYHVTFN